MSAVEHEISAVYWRMLLMALSQRDVAPSIDSLAHQVASDTGLTELILDTRIAIPTILQRFPELKSEFDTLTPASVDKDGHAFSEQEKVRRALWYSKLLMNVFGPNAQTAQVSAEQYSQWCDDVGFLEKALGYKPGELRRPGSGQKSGQPGSPGGADPNSGDPQAGGYGPGTSGHHRDIYEYELKQAFEQMEGDLVQRMSMKEVLEDPDLVEKLNPSMPMVEQLLREKSNLSGVALKNAKRLIKMYVDKLAEVMKMQVHQAAKGKSDKSVPPKKVFRNLDLKKTVWKNLTHWNEDDQRLYVDKLYYLRRGAKRIPTRLIVVVDQSGSMLDSMVQTTILASIFAGLPNVDVHLIAFDTNVIDLTPWVNDPFEVLLRTNLGGGNDGPRAMRELAMPKILEPKQTAMVWISDFYEFQNDQPLFDLIKQVKEMGVHFIPVGALKSSGYFSLNPWFRTALKQIGLTVLNGSISKLIDQLRYILP